MKCIASESPRVRHQLDDARNQREDELTERLAQHLRLLSHPCLTEAFAFGRRQ